MTDLRLSKMKHRNSTPRVQTPFARGWGFLDLFRTASSRALTRTVIAVAVAWVPLTLLSALRGRHIFFTFLTDYALQSRFLIILPVLILADSQVHQRLALVAHQLEADMVPHDQWPEFQAVWNSCERLRVSYIARVLMVILTYATAAFLSQYLSPTGSEFISWWTGGGWFKGFSSAGLWAFFVGYPILVYFTFLWIWKHFLWARFLRSTTQLRLSLIAAHPDRVGGLAFLEASILAQIPFSFCLGVGLAGAIANQVLHQQRQLFAFRFLAVGLLVGALVFCLGPYLVFTRTLMQMRRQGMLSYGAFARAVGEQFERKWLHQAENLKEDVLLVPDFSTVGDLYGVVHNIDEIRIVPVGLVNVYAIVIAAAIPALPVVVAAIPFNELIRAAMHLLF
jgi:hypothetical protein